MLKNCYDFDHTIYRGDSTIDFYKFCLKSNPKILLAFPYTLWALFLFIIGIYSKTLFKEVFYRFLTYVTNVDETVEGFWHLHKSKIANWYLEQKADDIIISASPDFLLRPMCNSLGVTLIASIVGNKNGKYDGENCEGEEKVRRFREEIPDCQINRFYSDSLKDTPLSLLAQESYIVSGENCIPWDAYRSSKFTKLKDSFVSREFVLFVLCGGIGTATNFLLSLLISSYIDPVVSYAIAYAISLFVTYSLNAKLNFRTSLSFKKFISFVFSYIPNYVILFTFVYIFINLAGWNKILVYGFAALLALPVTFLLVKIFTFKKK